MRVGLAGISLGEHWVAELRVAFIAHLAMVFAVIAALGQIGKFDGFGFRWLRPGLFACGPHQLFDGFEAGRRHGARPYPTHGV